MIINERRNSKNSDPTNEISRKPARTGLRIKEEKEPGTEQLDGAQLPATANGQKQKRKKKNGTSNVGVEQQDGDDNGQRWRGRHGFVCFFFAVGVFFFVSLGVPKTRVACAPLERALNDAAEVRSAFLSPAVAEISSLGDKRPIEKKTGKENGKNEKKGPRSRRKQSNRSNTSDSSNRSLKCVQRMKPS